MKIEQKMKAYAEKGCLVPPIALLKTKQQLEGIRESSKLNIAVLDYISDFVKEGISTEEINRLIHNKTVELGGYPAPLGFGGYPKSVCVSMNDVVCHGIPSNRVILKDGDIVNVDVSTEYRGYYSDSSRMYLIGNVSEEKKRLVDVTKECVELGISQVKPWGFLGDIGQIIYTHAKKNHYTVVKEIGGHGIGLQFHEEPYVSYIAKAGTGMLLVPGLVFTIEPMINMGKSKVVTKGNDSWTVYTYDGKPSAQWESMVLVTDTGCELLAY